MKLCLRNNVSATYLSKENTTCLKGLCAIGVLVHHLFQYSGLVQNIYLRVILQSLGFLMVALFFFLSGYGLQVSYKKAPDIYLKNFPKQRIAPYYLIIIILIAIYSFALLWINSSLDYITVVRSFFFSDTIIANGWYLQIQLLMYFAFYLINRFIKSDKEKSIAWLLFLLLYVLLSIAFDAGITRYVSVFAFFIGIKWADYKRIVDNHLNHKRRGFLIYVSVFVSFVVSYMIWWLTDGYISICVQMICEVFFTVFVIICLRFIPINCFVTRFLGRISLGIYVIQGVFLKVFRCDHIYIENGWLYVVLVCTGTFIGGVVLTPLFEKIYSLFKNRKISCDI
ncbi:MAG: acyltransferase [Clostridia bacterium]|nr:acyltransferase [Clostridia bacterium]